MKRKDLLYIILMVFFTMLSYFFFDRGFNARTKIIVNYKENSNVSYKVYLHENDSIKDEYMDMDKRYITKLVDSINFNFKYNNVFSNNLNGYYSYDVMATLYAYEKDSGDLIVENTYSLIDRKTIVLNQNDVKKINIEDKFMLDYDKYLDEYLDIKKNYNIDTNAYLAVSFNIYKNLLFEGIEKEVKDDNKIIANIPLSNDTFRIKVINENDKIDNYYDFSTKEKINFIFLLIGAFLLSLGISFMALVIRQMVLTYFRKSVYERELKKILSEYDDIIVKVKKFYNKKKYNLIYVDSFNELIEIYKKVRNPISFREIKKDNEAIFILIDEDNAWIYRMINKE